MSDLLVVRRCPQGEIPDWTRVLNMPLAAQRRINIVSVAMLLQKFPKLDWAAVKPRLT